MKVLVVGLGEVGKPLYEIIAESGRFQVYGYDIDPSKTVNKLEEIPSPIDYLHVAIPFTTMESFLKAVETYITRFKPKLIFIHSTVAPGTTRRVHERTGIAVAYTPVRGKHPCLKQHMLFWSKWVATLPPSALQEAKEHLESIGFKVRICHRNPETLELAKLWETVYRAIMIAAWQELHRIALRFGADILEVAEFIAEVHEVLKDRPVMYPGVIGGHCLIPNTRILNSVYPSKLFEFVLESNEARRDEIKDPKVAEDVEKLKEVALRLTNPDYYACKPAVRTA